MKPTQSLTYLLPPLRCAEQDNVVLRELAETMVVQSIEQYNSLETSGGVPADTARWKELRKKEGVRIFKECGSKNDPLELSSLLLLGSVEGKLENVMYAVVTPSEGDMRIKSAVIQDGVKDCRVLHEVDRPTMAEPFHHVNVQWRLYAQPKERDYLCLDASGFATSAEGERIGYHLTHSVGFEQVPSFADYGVKRGNMSVCSLYVQRANSSSIVDVYARGYYDLGGCNDLLNHATLSAIVTHWMAYPRKPECAHMKKLLWAVRKNNHQHSILSLSSEDYERKSVAAAATPGLCKVCSRSFGFLGTSRRRCNACDQQVCTRCAVTKLVVAFAPDQGQVVHKKRTFCSHCMDQVGKRDGMLVAREEILNAGNMVATAFY